MIISQSFCIFDPATASDCEITHPTLKDLVAANHGLDGWVKKKILVDPRKFLMVWVMRTILGQYGHSDTKYSQILFGLRRVVDVLVEPTLFEEIFRVCCGLKKINITPVNPLHKFLLQNRLNINTQTGEKPCYKRKKLLQ